MDGIVEGSLHRNHEGNFFFLWGNETKNVSRNDLSNQLRNTAPGATTEPVYGCFFDGRLRKVSADRNQMELKLAEYQGNGVNIQPFSPSEITESPGGGEFYNPFTFIDDHGSLPWRLNYTGDLNRSGPPNSFHRHSEDHYTGELRVIASAVSPLLFPQLVQNQNGHKTYQMRAKGDNVFILESEIKGMLSHYFEALTHSRMRVFSHREPLGRRKGIGEAAEIVPCKVRQIFDDGAMEIEMLRGIPGMSPAAWVPMSMVERASLTHGQLVTFSADHYRKEDRQIVSYLKVSEVVANGVTTNRLPNEDPGDSHRLVQANIVAGVTGWVVKTGQLIRNKHDERIFFGTSELVTLGPAEGLRLIDRFRLLIADYQRNHEDGRNPQGHPAVMWNEYIAQGQTDLVKRDKQMLKVGMLLYASVVNGSIRSLSPVMSSREVDDHSPYDKLSEALRPAKKAQQMTIADRVFGWTPEDGDSEKIAYRSKFRIVDVNTDQAIIESIPGGLTLAVLNGPKPSKNEFYRRGEKPRGTKMYRPQTAPTGYWTQNRNQKNYTRDVADQVNSTFNNWVKPESEFQFTIRFENLTKFELAALIRLLDLNHNETVERYLRIGYAKPLGFGTIKVRVDHDASWIADHHAVKAFYGDLEPDQMVNSGINVGDWIKEFNDEMDRAFTEVPSFLTQYMKACEPIPAEQTHYPRPSSARADASNGHQWKGWKQQSRHQPPISIPELMSREQKLKYLP
jgi:CRISPR-associated protein (TIGR03986 family)